MMNGAALTRSRIRRTRRCRSSRRIADAELARELADLTRSANRANTTITPSILAVWSGWATSASRSTRSNGRNSFVSPRTACACWRKKPAASPSSTRTTSQGAQANRCRTNDYYVGYYSKNPDRIKRRRQVEVKVARATYGVGAQECAEANSGARVVVEIVGRAVEEPQIRLRLVPPVHPDVKAASLPCC